MHKAKHKPTPHYTATALLQGLRLRVAHLLIGALCATALVPGADYRQLLRLPLLASHYIQSQGCCGDQSLVDFLVEHYGSTDGHTHTAEHADLPLYQLQVNYAFLSLCYPPALPVPVVEMPLKHNAYYLRFNPKPPLLGLLRPPCA